MTIPRLAGMNRYWLQHPPTHIAVKIGLGIEAKEEKSKTFDDFIRDFTAQGGKIDGV